jgi:hypothetical protein
MAAWRLLVVVWLAACTSQPFVQVTVASTDASPLAGAIVAVTCRLDATVSGKAATTDAAGFASIEFVQSSTESRELSDCELTVANQGYVTQQQAIALCDDDTLAGDCVFEISLVEEP